MDPKEHWEQVYRTRSVTEVSWYQREARVSLDLIDRVADPRTSVVLDAGGGASTLAGGLVRRGYRRVLVVDLVPAALEAARAKLGKAGDAEVSWYQKEARVSLDLIDRVADPRTSVVLDAGGGASTLVDGLVRWGYRRVMVADLVPAALEAARARVGKAGGAVTWVTADVLTHPFSPGSIDVWHDRAVFHFLTDPEDRRRYVAQVRRAVRPGGHVIVATFAADGPTRCSGLDVCRYGAEALHREFDGGFDLVAQVREEHVTPAGVVQAFQYCLCTYDPARVLTA